MQTLLLPIFTTAILLLASTAGAAERYHYTAEVEGMVCAFCAYNVSKKLETVEGIDADSIVVDLVDGSVRFNASGKIEEKQLAALFNDSGFTLNHLQRKGPADQTQAPRAEPALLMHIDPSKIDRFTPLLESLGEMAADSPLQLRIRAAATEEKRLLKPILMGRQQVIKTRFEAAQDGKVRIEVFAP